jgi:hypothetical protein
VIANKPEVAQVLSTFEKEWTFGNLRIYPIMANEVYKEKSKVSSNYISLQQALQKKSIVISEVSEGGTVNTLQLSNTGKDTVMIMAGEVVLGGKQDRAIGQEMLLPPGAKNVNVAVFCVEHGRWNANQSGSNFNGYYGFVGNQVRKKVIVDKNQSNVWSEVSKSHNKAAVSSGTNTFKDIQKSEEYMTQLKSYKDYFLPKLKALGSVLGFVVVTGDKILGTELFSSADIFNQQSDKLLESYITEAMQEGAPVTINSALVEKSLMQILNESIQEDMIKQNGTEIKAKNHKVHISVLGK